MELKNIIPIPVSPQEAWPILLDLERIAPMIPGASITGVDGDEFEGKAKIKVGPITAEYVGVARFLELDEKGHRAVIEARAKDARGQGNMKATITARLEPDANGSVVIVETELDMTGKLAQFGRGVITEAATAILGLFAQRLAAEMTGGNKQSNVNSAEQSATTSPTHLTRPAPTEPEALDLIKLAKETRASKKVVSAEGQAVGPWLPVLISVLAALVAVFAAGIAVGSNRKP
ncbi:SRPBCC family protein [Glutamicibacter nicotianae]|uniref:Carbon monoxide dehydrogenase subunit G family protein n=1 Tax=Glutamicibacter nicotianae TaxID=37929 RepID=A0ABQ0RQA0_GLUNI|nr:SRPBCC family protein [Glutamicibacter nicotianae]GEC13997.1 carbon monoxide dehydrogenase subunit G family protein [Glutamicibacter nicotianae]